VYLFPEWGISSAGRAPALQAGGRRFDPVILHHLFEASQDGLDSMATSSVGALGDLTVYGGSLAQLVRAPS
jgi:hypothetical protein